jgi:pimeloyl-ACP methyl ester carboxylesterase
MAAKPTLIFVPGAWHTVSPYSASNLLFSSMDSRTPGDVGISLSMYFSSLTLDLPRQIQKTQTNSLQAETWTKVTTLLEAKHYTCICVTLPSTLGNPNTTFFDDIKAVRDPIIAETTAGRNVVVIVHSYGGAVGCSAVKGFTSPSTGRPGRVIGIASMASGFGPSGVCFIDNFGGKPPPTWTFDAENAFVTLVTPPRELFYHDLPEEEAEYWISKLTKQAAKPLMDKEGGQYAYAGWMDVPIWYLATTEDRAFGPAPVEAQKYVVQVARDAGADVTAREVESSHSPMLSKPEEVAEFIEEAATAFVG